MKQILTTLILASLALGAQAEDKSATEKARDTANAIIEKTKEVVVDAAQEVRKSTREGWAKTKAYVSNEMPLFQEGANKSLGELATEIAAVKATAPSKAPAYFRTRLLALDEQHEYLVKRLASLSPEQVKDRSSGPRHDFDQCVGDLEQAIDQAKEEAGTLPKIAQEKP